MTDKELNLAKLTENLDELSLKKQLPLRKQVQKPLLKYNTHITKPITFINQRYYYTKDGHPTQLVTGTRGTPRHTVQTSGHSPIRDSARIFDHKHSASTASLSSGVDTTGTRSTSFLAHQKQTKSHTNPYTRPLSAKEVVEDIQCHQQITKPAHSFLPSPEKDNPFNGVLQLNTFMRPQSAAFNEPAVQQNPPRKIKVKTIESGSTIYLYHEPNSLKSNLTKTGHLDQISQDEIFAKPPLPTGMSNLHSLTSMRNLSPSTSDQRSKIRNLNYTPAKPYSEVSDPHIEAYRCSTSGSSNSSTPSIISHAQACSAKRSAPPLTMTVPLSEIHCKSLQNLTAITNINSELGNEGMGKKVPASSSLTGTIYYKKDSKACEDLFEQRPIADGAPCKHQKVYEKGFMTEEEESFQEYEDSEAGLPAGERFPGDGEASFDEFYESDDGIDEGDEVDELEGSDFGEGESDDACSISSTLSHRSIRSYSTQLLLTKIKSRPLPRPFTAMKTQTVAPAVRQSLFAKIPPTINFVPEGEKVEQLPWDIRKLLKWKMSPITPNVVKSALSRAGFRITKRNHDWLGCFGKHMKSPGFKFIKEYQKLNHFPGSFQIGRKDRLWRNLIKMQVHFGKKEFGFFPQTYILPFDLKPLKRAWEEGGNKQKWIIKPPASARGIGIKVIHKWNQIPRRKPVIVQRYLSRPYLINDSKFDMRLYVYVTCYDPLKIYIYEDGLARFASCKYSSSMKSLSNKFMHLTNYSVNKKNVDYQNNADDTVCQGHKWSLKSLWHYLKQKCINTAVIWDSIKDLVIKTVICSESAINSLIKANVRSRYCVHELFGFDILLDEHLKPWILEVNISPSLHSNSQLDVNIKGHMIADLLNMASFHIPDKHDVTHHSNSSSACDLSSYTPPNSYCMDKRLFTQQFSPHERAKHAYYCQRHQDEQVVQTITDTLTPDDIRILTQCIDEDSKKGGFQRIFPTPHTHKYLKCFEQARYYNLLLDHWVQRYNKFEKKGISLLQSMCEDGIHLESITDNPLHQWNPPSFTITGYWDSRGHQKSKESDSAPKISSNSLSQLSKLAKSTNRSTRQPLVKSSSSNSIASLSSKSGSSSRLTSKPPLPQTSAR